MADETSTYAELPEGLTSFGAARIGSCIYVYGGHTGTAHSYSHDGQSGKLRKLDLDQAGSGWEVVSEDQHLQGLGLVAYGQSLVRVGGFTATNEEGEDHDLHSLDDVKMFDTVAGEWKPLPSLPAGRSSHDAALIGDTLYVVGGWKMDTPNDTHWHTTALTLDLADEKAQWKELPKPPFERRALAIAAHKGKLYVVGGMNHTGGPTRDVVVFDPETQKWSDGPELLGDAGMVGFGASAWSHDGKLTATCYSGEIQQLSDDGSKWVSLGQSRDARFFHRLLPLEPGKLLAVGGASMESGKFLEPEVIATGAK